MTNETPIITQLRETINRAENMVPFMRGEMIQLLEGAKCEIETLAANSKQMQSERDEARRERDDAKHNLAGVMLTIKNREFEVECIRKFHADWARNA